MGPVSTGFSVVICGRTSSAGHLRALLRAGDRNGLRVHDVDQPRSR